MSHNPYGVLTPQPLKPQIIRLQLCTINRHPPGVLRDTTRFRMLTSRVEVYRRYGKPT